MFMYVCTSFWVQMHIYAQACGEQELKEDVFLKHSGPSILEQACLIKPGTYCSCYIGKQDSPQHPSDHSLPNGKIVGTLQNAF